jgi:aminodeoxyfutalosine synthase
MNGTLEALAGRMADGAALTDADADLLASTSDIVTLGIMADEVRRARHGRRTTFVRVAHVQLDGLEDRALEPPAAARELRLGGAFPGLDAAIDALTRAASHEHLPVGAFSLADIETAAASDGARLVEWLTALRTAGLAFVAEAPIDRLASPGAALSAAADCGMTIARLTADGRDGSPLDRIRRIRDLGPLAGVAQAVAPLPRRPGSEPTTGYEDVKAVALARLLLDVDHVQVDWTLHGPKLAQVALTFGADDVDNVSAFDEVAEGRRRAPLEEIRRNIRAASLDPVERDARFTVLG